MGKRGDRRKVKIPWLLILLILSCAYPKPEGIGYTLYRGRFLLTTPWGETESGSWEALEREGRIEKVYLYNPMGFPLASIKIEGNLVIIDRKRKIHQEFRELILIMSKLLPKVKDKKIFDYRHKNTHLKKRGNIITIESGGYRLKVKVFLKDQ